MITQRTFAALIMLAASGTLQSADYFAAPNGRASATGNQQDPWDLATALAHPPSVRPGDRIWLRGGVYKGLFRSTLSGAAQAPIVVRAHANERAILDSDGLGSQNQAALSVMGSHTWYWGIEITNSNRTRVFANAFRDCFDRQHCRAPAVSVFGPGVKLINLVIHDTGDGIGLWAPAIDAEAYGNIVFYTGWQSEVRGNGHSLYVQNHQGTKRVVDNVLFSGFHSGVHFYGSSSASLRNLHIEGNTIFNTGVLAQDPNGWGILIGGLTAAENVTVSHNLLFNPEWLVRGNNLNPSYGKGTDGILLEGNYSAGHVAISSDLAPKGLRAVGNVFAGAVSPSLLEAIRAQPSNTIVSYQSMLGQPNRIFIRPNRYEPNKAIVTVFNWRRTAEAELDLSTFLKQGDQFEIIDLQNYFGPAVRSGSFDGRPIPVSMSSGSGQPIGAVPGQRYRTGVEFGVFQVRILKSSTAAAPALRLSQPAFQFSCRPAGAPPPAQALTVTSPEGSASNWVAEPGASWLRVARPAVDGGTQRLLLTIDPEGLVPGAYTSEIRLVREATEVQSVPVSVWVTESGSSPVIDAVTNAASRMPAISTGSLIAIQGLGLADAQQTAAVGEMLPTELLGTSVSIAGVSAHLLSVSSQQLLAVVPVIGDSAAPRDGEVEIVVNTPLGTASARVNLLPTVIGLFERESPSGHLAATYSDGRLVGGEPSDPEPGFAPARAGDLVSLYLTGLFHPAHPVGLPLASPLAVDDTLEVLWGGAPATVTFAGLTHPGLGQVNVVVPDTPAGPQLVVVRYRNAESQASAYLPVVR